MDLRKAHIKNPGPFMTIEIFGAYSGYRKQQENFQESAISINTKAQGSMERLEHPPAPHGRRLPCAVRGGRMKNDLNNIPIGWKRNPPVI